MRKHILEVFHTPLAPLVLGLRVSLCEVLMQNALALAGERVGPTGTWVTRPFSACGTQIKPPIIGGEKGNYLMFVMLHNNSIVLSDFSVASPVFHLLAWISFQPQFEN